MSVAVNCTHFTVRQAGKRLQFDAKYAHGLAKIFPVTNNKMGGGSPKKKSTTTVLEEGNSVNSGSSFASLKGLDTRLQEQLKFLKYEWMTQIQKKCIQPLLSDLGSQSESRSPKKKRSLVEASLELELPPSNDALIRAQTGSGKTLAFLVPMLQRLLAIERLKRAKLAAAGLIKSNDLKTVVIERSSGTRALVLAPTRELVTQNSEVCAKLCQTHYWITVNSLVCGTKKKGEKTALRKGVTVLFATPGRILDHLNTTASFKIDHLATIVIDEIDRLVDYGFEAKLKKIIHDIKEARERAIAARSDMRDVKNKAKKPRVIEIDKKFLATSNNKKNIKINLDKFDDEEDDAITNLPNNDSSESGDEAETAQDQNMNGDSFSEDETEVSLESASDPDAVSAKAPIDEIASEDSALDEGQSDLSGEELMTDANAPVSTDGCSDELCAEEDAETSTSSAGANESDSESSSVVSVAEPNSLLFIKPKSCITSAVLEEYEVVTDLQMILVSATLNASVEKMAKFALREGSKCFTDSEVSEAEAVVEEDRVDPVEETPSSFTIPSCLKQSAVILDNVKMRFMVLAGLILMRKPGSRTLIFVDTCETAEYLYNVCGCLKWPKLPDDKMTNARRSQREQAIKHLSNKIEEATADLEDVLFGGNSGPLAELDAAISQWTDESMFGKQQFYRLHGQMKREDREGSLKDFLSTTEEELSTMIVTDVAARGLNFQNVDLVIQFEIACDLNDYVHRAGRTARIGQPGICVMILNPEEADFLKILERNKIISAKHTCARSNEDKILNCFKPGHPLCKLPKSLAGLRPQDSANFLLSRCTQYVDRDSDLLKLATRSYFASIKNYRSYDKSLRSAFDAEKLHLGRLAGALLIRKSPNELKFKFSAEEQAIMAPESHRGGRGRMAGKVTGRDGRFDARAASRGSRGRSQTPNRSKGRGGTFGRGGGPSKNREFTHSRGLSRGSGFKPRNNIASSSQN